MFAYFDNSATTPILPSVNEEMAKMYNDCFFNPSSLHKGGVLAEERIDFAREVIAKSINADKGEIYFTSGGTESNNLCIRGFLKKNKRLGNKIICDSIEHASVKSLLDSLKEEGYEVKVIDCCKDKGFSYEELENAVDENTALVTVMQVNNETGYIFDTKRISEIIKKKNPKTVFHCDCVQSYMKLKINVKAMGADLISISSHKINGPKGVGAIYVRKGIMLAPVLYGGGQEKNLRSGTENSVGIYGFGLAAKWHMEHFYENERKYAEIKEYLREKFEALEGAIVNTPKENSAPHILNVSFYGVRSEILLHTFEQKDIFVSGGSACSSNDKKKKKILQLMGYDKAIYDSSIRFSFGIVNDLKQAEYAFNEIKNDYLELRKRLKIK